MLILLAPAPPFAPAMDVNTIDKFLRFKTSHPGTELKTSFSSKPLKDVFGNQICAEGTWKNPQNGGVLRAGVSNLHVHQNHVAEYTDTCEAYRALPQRYWHRGCHQHAGSPRQKRKNNPVDHAIFGNSAKRVVLDARDASYEEVGCSQLLPSDLRHLQKYLLSFGSLSDLQFWVMIIVAVSLFLRHDELHNIQADHFKEDLFEMYSGRIDSLVIEIFEKSGKRRMKLRLRADNKYPDLCPVRPLLIYLHLTNYKGGYLFPSSTELESPPSNSIFQTSICFQNS